MGQPGPAPRSRRRGPRLAARRPGTKHRAVGVYALAAGVRIRVGVGGRGPVQAGDGQDEAARCPGGVGGGFDGVGSRRQAGDGDARVRVSQARSGGAGGGVVQVGMVVVSRPHSAGPVAGTKIQEGVHLGFHGDGYVPGLSRGEGVIAGVVSAAFLGQTVRGPRAGSGAVRDGFYATIPRARPGPRPRRRTGQAADGEGETARFPGGVGGGFDGVGSRRQDRQYLRPGGVGRVVVLFNEGAAPGAISPQV